MQTLRADKTSCCSGLWTMGWRGRRCPSHQPRRKKQEVCFSFIHLYSLSFIHSFIHGIEVERMHLLSARKEEVRGMLYSFTSFIHSFNNSFIHSFMGWRGRGCSSHQPRRSRTLEGILLIHSFIKSDIHAIINSVISITHSIIHLYIYLFIRSCIHSFIHSFNNSFIHSIIHTFIH